MKSTHNPNTQAPGLQPTRGCPLCAGAAVRTARNLPDRVLSLLMPVKRYRCCAQGCGWEGLLLPRMHPRAPRATRSSRARAVRLLSPPLGCAAALAGMTQRRPALMAFRARLP